MRDVPGRSRSTSRRAAGLGREAALYFRLAGAGDGSEAAEAAADVRALADGLDWEAFRRLARRDGTTAAVHRRLRAAGVVLPDPAADALAREARVLDFHRLVLDGAVRAAADELAGAGLRVVLLKGAALSRTAYARPGDRPMSDADLLLAPEEASAAAVLLRARGWTLAGDGAEERRYAGHHHLPPLRAPGGGRSVVELHRDVLPPGHPFAWGGAEVMERARRLDPADAALVPACADLLLHAGLHFAWSHEMRQGAWRAFADVAALVARHESGGRCRIDGGGAPCEWPGAGLERATAARATSAVAWTLRLARDVAGVRLPPALDAVAAEARGGALLARHLAAALVPGGEGTPSVRLSRLLWERAMRPAGSGHGRARPWLVGVAGERGGGGAAATSRAVGQLRRVAAWRRYGWRVLGR